MRGMKEMVDFIKDMHEEIVDLRVQLAQCDYALDEKRDRIRDLELEVETLCNEADTLKATILSVEGRLED